MNTLVGRVAELLETTFWTSCIFPAALGTALAAALAVVLAGGPDAALTAWEALSASVHIWAGAIALGWVVLVAMVLNILATPTVRWYEGYLFRWGLDKWLIDEQEELLDELKRQLPEVSSDPAAARNPQAISAYQKRHEYFPPDGSTVRSTLLGNALAAAEEYPYTAFRIDSVRWWPRFWHVIPASFRSEINRSYAGVLAGLNLCTVLFLFAVGGAVSILYFGGSPWLFLLTFPGGLLTAYLSYRLSVERAVALGVQIRSVFDLYRGEVLKRMGIGPPQSLQDEMVLWTVLNDWITDGSPPWGRIGQLLGQAGGESNVPKWLEEPFQYDLGKSQGSAEAQGDAAEVIARGLVLAATRIRQTIV